jgi:hypothetical protein
LNPEKITLRRFSGSGKAGRDIRHLRVKSPIVDWLAPVLAAIFGVLVGAFATPYMGVATFSYCMMLGGLILRQQRRIHVGLMIAAIITDLTLVLVLEFQRNAIATAMEFSLTPLQQAHILASGIATVLYFGVLYLGVQRLLGNGGKTARHWHLRIGLLAFAFRTIGFFLMFSLLAKNAS